MQNEEFECASGAHEYTIPDEEFPDIKICEHCKRKGYDKRPDGLEIWTEYDDKGNRIHYKDSTGFEKWKEYDDNGNEIHIKDSTGYEVWIGYDDAGNEIYWKSSNGEEYRKGRNGKWIRIIS